MHIVFGDYLVQNSDASGPTDLSLKYMARTDIGSSCTLMFVSVPSTMKLQWGLNKTKQSQILKIKMVGTFAWYEGTL